MRLRRLLGRVRDATLGARVYVEPPHPASVPVEPHSPRLEFGTANHAASRVIDAYARRHRRGTFLDVGGNVGTHRWIAGPLDYWVLDLERRYERAIVGDICECPQVADASFDVVFSNNVFEHLAEPWRAATEIGRILKPGGICCTITWFAIRFHPVPDDYWRFTHSALELLFERYAGLETLESGYDLRWRRDGRNDKHPDHADCAPGGWDENWIVFHLGRKPLAAASDAHRGPA